MGGSLLLLLAFSGGEAQAWYHLGHVWRRTNIPIEWYMADVVDDSIDPDYVTPAIEEAWAVWTDGAPCAEVDASYMGVRDGYDKGFNQDGIYTFTFEDPDDDLEGTTLGATVCFPSGEFAFARDDISYTYTYDCDIVFNDYVDWGEWDDIEAGNCNDEYSLKGVITHEIGHSWGLGHSCDDPADDAASAKPAGVSCSDPDLRFAVMFWSTGPCNNAQSALTSDDLDGMNALYGPYCSFEASVETERFGGAPLEVCFDVECNEDPGEFTWNFGDGATDTTTLNACHTYEDKGQFSVSLSTSGSASECGDWSNEVRERAYVLVCGQPEPAEDFTGLFTYEHFDGLTYQMVNQTDTSVYGCIDQIQWDVFKGDTLIQSLSAWSPKIEFPEEGEYRVVLNVGGPGGVSAGEIKIDAVDQKGERGGCEVVSGTAVGLTGMLIAFGAAIRRRED